MLTDKEKAILLAIHEMDQSGETPERVDDIVEMLRWCMAQEKRAIYRFLVALTRTMNCCNYHKTGKLLDQAAASFSREAQGQ